MCVSNKETDCSGEWWLKFSMRHTLILVTVGPTVVVDCASTLDCLDLTACGSVSDRWSLGELRCSLRYILLYFCVVQYWCHSGVSPSTACTWAHRPGVCTLQSAHVHCRWTLCWRCRQRQAVGWCRITVMCATSHQPASLRCNRREVRTD